MGNFLACLGCRVMSGDTEFENHLKKLSVKMQAKFQKRPRMS